MFQYFRKCYEYLARLKEEFDFAIFWATGNII